VPEESRRREQAVGTALARVATLSLRFLLVCAAVVVLWFIAGQLWVVILPVLLALLLATVLWPAVRFLRGKGAPPALAAAVVLVVSLLLLFGLLGGLAPQVTSQSEELADQVTAGLGEVQGYVTGPPLNLGEDQVGRTVDNAIDELQSNAQNIATRVLSGAAAAGSLLVTTLLALVLCFFYLKDGPKFLPWLSGLVGPRAAPHVSAVAQRSWVTLSSFIKAQAAVGLVDAIFIGVGLAVLGVPLALPLAVLVFFGAFIPIIGAVVTGILAALVALVTQGPTTALIVIGLVLVVQQLEGNVLQPILVGRSMDLHPALVILAVTAGGTLAGITGAFLAVPVVAVGAVVVRYARQQLAVVEPGPGSPPAAAGQPNEEVVHR
jgi:predicted PurR-regulated permease PerM